MYFCSHKHSIAKTNTREDDIHLARATCVRRGRFNKVIMNVYRWYLFLFFEFQRVVVVGVRNMVKRNTYDGTVQTNDVFHAIIRIILLRV